MERIGRKALLSRNKKARKLLNASGFWVSNQLVRMRSPVQIWSAAPRKSPKSSDLGDYSLIFATFRGRLKIRNDLLDEETGFLQKILQFFGGHVAIKPLSPNGFRVFWLANILQFTGLIWNRHGQRLRQRGKSFPGP